MSYSDLTIEEVLQDPVIRLLMRADGVSLESMRTLLTNTAAAQRTRLAKREHQDVESIASESRAYLLQRRKRGTGGRFSGVRGYR